MKVKWWAKKNKQARQKSKALFRTIETKGMSRGKFKVRKKCGRTKIAKFYAQLSIPLNYSMKPIFVGRVAD
jgi:inorganic pyrophosphatase